jgi:CheY-like chemotaxis protein
MPYRILVLEDDEISAQVLNGMLEPQGHDVALAARSSDAWVALRQKPADLLVLDTNLNGEQGWEFLEAVRSHPFFSPLPTVVYSGVSQRGIVQKYMRLGVQGMLVKPYSADRLTAEVVRLTQTCWRDKLFEPVETLRARTGFSDEKLAEIYRHSAKEIDRVLADVSPVLKRDPGDSDAIKRVTSLRSVARNIGFPALEKVVNDAEKGALNFENDRVMRVLTDMPAAVSMLRERAARLAPEPEEVAPVEAAVAEKPAPVPAIIADS